MSLPPLQKPHKASIPASPEALFQTQARAKSHGYLRGPQQDALRAFIDVSSKQDVALELPTGAGKTSVGLLIAEWQRRRTRTRTAYVCLTNQLCAQVLNEASALRIPVADLRGSKEERDPSEVGRFKDAGAIAISTYSNLFNVKPVLTGCGTIVFDDAHGGGHYASGMYTVRLSRHDFPDQHAQLLAIVRPLLTDSQLATLGESSSAIRPALIDFEQSESAKQEVGYIFDALPIGSSPSFPWRLLRGHIDACHLLISNESAVLRPYIAPIFDHAGFADVRHRIYLSATLGDVEDLKRAYALEEVAAIYAAQKQDGRRYIFVPGLAMGEDQVLDSVASVWQKLIPRRAVAIAPSFVGASKVGAALESVLPSSAAFLDAKAIEDSLAPFTQSNDAVLLLANRYDGLDLPDDDCRLLMLYESPRAVNELEANLSSYWKLGPALRWREATRLAQGMGRCTRSATDFAIILLLGQSLIDSITNPQLVDLLPPILKSEIDWGRIQVGSVAKDPDTLAAVIAGLIGNADYRKQADDAIAEVAEGTQPDTTPTKSVAISEVRFAKAIWNGDSSFAQETAQAVVDSLSGDEWAGYRCWWLYLWSVAARSAGNRTAQLEALKRAKGTGINSGWLDSLIRRAMKSAGSDASTMDDGRHAVGERVWNAIDELGWSGPKFGAYGKAMIENLGATSEHKRFHEGLAMLGKLLGAIAERPTGQGDPDVIWKFTDLVWICFEAKSEKLVGGAGLSKKDLLQASGHIEWINFFKSQGKGNLDVTAVVVAAEKKILEVAEPHKGSLYFLGTTDALTLAKDFQERLFTLRTRFFGHDFGAVQQSFVAELQRLHCDFGSTLARIKGTLL